MVNFGKLTRLGRPGFGGAERSMTEE
jgi:hypothetical protein